MPNPKEFSNKKDWMDSCMHQLRKVENKDQDQSVAICLNRWRDKNKKSARRVVGSFLEAVDKESGIWTEPKRIPRLKERLKRYQPGTPAPAGKDTPFAEEGEEIIEILPGGREVKKPYNPATMKNKNLKLVEK